MTDDLDSSRIRLDGVQEIDGTMFAWEVIGEADRHSVKVSHPKYGSDVAELGERSILAVVQLLARELRAKKQN